MISYGKETKLKPDQVIDRAVQFFGPGGLGLQVEDQGGGCARFTGGGGYVYLSTCEGAKATEVSLEAREWEYQVKEFAGRL
jgi:hypothetical protein